MAVFGGHLDLSDSPAASDGEGSQGLSLSRHTQLALEWEGRGSTRIFSANWLLMAKRALQTRQIRLFRRLRSLICCSSHSPNSRNRRLTSPDAPTFLTRT